MASDDATRSGGGRSHRGRSRARGLGARGAAATGAAGAAAAVRAIALWTALACGLIGAGAAGAAPPEPACSRDSTLTLFGLDTAAGRALFALPAARSGEPDWWLEWAAGGTEATYRAAGGARPFAGSVGPGAVFGVRRCGTGCLQPVRWEDGAWRPLGGQFAGDGGTVHTTYDRAGDPWVVLHRATDGEAVEAAAWRLGDGGLWKHRGTLRARGVGTVGATPDPSSAGGVLSGSARFHATEPPRHWVEGLPALPPERSGELLPGGVAGGKAAALYLDAGGRFYLSEDAGATWRRSEWAPWGETRARLWHPGRDYSVDLPAGDRRPPFVAAWFDRRDPAAERLHLAEWIPGRGWAETAALAPRMTTLDGEVLAFDHLLRPSQGSWLLLAGCVHTAAGPGLALRTAGPEGRLSKPRFVPLAPDRETRPAGPPGR